MDSVNRRRFLGMSGAATLTGMMNTNVSGATKTVSQSGNSAATSPKRPMNMIIFLPDEMRADSLACYGNPVTKTPNFARFAQEGTRFDQCHVQYPVCGASRCALLTGWPTSVRGHRSLYYFLRPEEPNLFRYLRRAGYDVFWFGKNDALAAASFYDSVSEWSDVAPFGTGMPRMPESLTPGSLSMLYGSGGDRAGTGDYKNLQSAFKILARSEQDRPFCIFLPLNEPHPPYTVPEDFYGLYKPDALPPLVPPGLKKKPSFHQGIRKVYNLDKLPDSTFRKVRAVYYGQVSYSDWLFGELLSAVEKTGRANDTAIFVTSDHGDYAGDYGLVEKWPAGMEDCLTRVPLLARVPGMKSGTVDSEMREMYDIMQTCLDLAHVPTEQVHTHFSRSLLPQMQGAPGDVNRAAYCEGGYNIYEPQCFEPLGAGGGPYTGKIHLQNDEPETVSRVAMVRTKTHKLVRRPQGQSELYDVIKDPSETNNLFGETSSGAIQSHLTELLVDHYINTTGIAPKDKDGRDQPPFYPTTPKSGPPEWKAILDR